MNSARSSEQLVDSRPANEHFVEETAPSTIINDEALLVSDEISRAPSVYVVDAATLRGESRSKISTKDFNKCRFVNKSGELRVLSKNVPRKMKLYLADLFTTMIDLRWKWVILIFMTSYIFSWTLFGLIWWLIALLRGSSTCVTKVCKIVFCFLPKPFHHFQGCPRLARLKLKAKVSFFYFLFLQTKFIFM